MANNHDSNDDILSFAGEAIERANEVVKFLNMAIGFVKVLWVKYQKEKVNREFDLLQSRKLREEVAALGALSKLMMKRAGRQELDYELLKQIDHHIKSANSTSKKMGIHGEDPDFEVKLPSKPSVENITTNEPGMLLVESLFDEIQWHSFYMATRIE